MNINIQEDLCVRNGTVEKIIIPDRKWKKGKLSNLFHWMAWSLEKKWRNNKRYLLYASSIFSFVPIELIFKEMEERRDRGKCNGTLKVCQLKKRNAFPLQKNQAILGKNKVTLIIYSPWGNVGGESSWKAALFCSWTDVSYNFFVLLQAFLLLILALSCPWMLARCPSTARYNQKIRKKLMKRWKYV